MVCPVGGPITALCCYSLEEVFSNVFVRSVQGFDEDDVGVWLRFLDVEPLNAPGHDGRRPVGLGEKEGERAGI